MVRAGTFREDLYYRLNVVEIQLAPLRQRVEDIPLLVEHFARKHGGATPVRLHMHATVYDCLERHPWPGNVRELENLVRLLLVDCPSGEVRLEQLPARLRPQAAGEPQDWQRLDYQRRAPPHAGRFRAALSARPGSLSMAATSAARRRPSGCRAWRCTRRSGNTGSTCKDRLTDL